MRGVLAVSGGTALLVTLALLAAHSGSQRTALVRPGDFPTSPLVEYTQVRLLWGQIITLAQLLSGGFF